jgi:hypothetical protein
VCAWRLVQAFGKRHLSVSFSLKAVFAHTWRIETRHPEFWGRKRFLCQLPLSEDDKGDETSNPGLVRAAILWALGLKETDKWLSVSFWYIYPFLFSLRSSKVAACTRPGYPRDVGRASY